MNAIGQTPLHLKKKKDESIAGTEWHVRCEAVILTELEVSLTRYNGVCYAPEIGPHVVTKNSNFLSFIEFCIMFDSSFSHQWLVS